MELHDQEWFPAAWRNLATDFLSFFFKTFRPYTSAAPVLAGALRRAHAGRIVDLCSGAGQPVLSVLPELERLGAAPRGVVLTDKFPNLGAMRAAAAAWEGTVTCVERSVDATDVSQQLAGFRTLFTSFHHFRPPAARQILADACSKGEGIGIFEFTERNLWLWALPVLLIPAMVWVCTPLIVPFSWRRLLFTYLLPVVPVVAMWDGLVSNLRTYTVSELEAMTAGLEGPGYRWEAGRVRSLGLSRVTYLVGWPSPGGGAGDGDGDGGSHGPQRGPDPVAPHQQPVGGGVEAAREVAVAGDLQCEGRGPDREHQHQSNDREAYRHAARG